EDRGVAAADGTDGSRQRYRLAARQVLAQYERVDLGCRAAQGARLVVEGDRLRLGEVRRRQDGRDRERLDRVVGRVGHEPVRRLGELARDLRGVDVGPALRGHPGLTAE